MSDDTTQAAKRLAEMFERPGVNLTLHGIDVSATIHSLVARAEKAEAERDRLRAEVAAQVEAARREEREAAALIAEGKVYAYRFRTWPWWVNRDGSEGNRSSDSDIVQHADKIAAAIRARGDA
jgi:hypothetical protein